MYKTCAVYHPNGEFYTFSVWNERGEFVFADSAEHKTPEAALAAAKSYVERELSNV